MFTPLTITIFFFFLHLHLVSGSINRFYTGPSCSGEFFEFPDLHSGVCNKLVFGVGRSLYSNSGGLEHWVAFKHTSYFDEDSLCGYEVCSFSSLLSRCCTSASTNIKGAARFPYRLPVNPDHRDKKLVETNMENLLDDLASDNQTLISPSGPTVADFTFAEPGWQGFIELPDGTYHGFGDGIVQVSERELQRQLAAKGMPPLTATRIAELKALEFVKQ